MSLINWEIARNPLNWITVLVMVIIAGFAFDLIARPHVFPSEN